MIIKSGIQVIQITFYFSSQILSALPLRFEYSGKRLKVVEVPLKQEIQIWICVLVFSFFSNGNELYHILIKNPKNLVTIFFQGFILLSTFIALVFIITYSKKSREISHLFNCT